MAGKAITREKPELLEHPGGLGEFAPRERVAKEVPETVIEPGWAADRRPPLLNLSSDRPTKFTVPEREEVLIKFLDNKPLIGFWQHWVMTREGRRPYKCLETPDCPLCCAGDRAKEMNYFNVIVMSASPELQVWYASADPSKAIKERAASKRYSPINRDDLYFAVSKTKASSGFNTFTVDPVREDELESDWNVKPLTDEQIELFNSHRYNAGIVKIFTKADLTTVVRDNFE